MRAHSDPKLAHWRKRCPLVQYLKIICLDFAQQRAVDVGHHQSWFLAVMVSLGQKGKGFVIDAVGTFRLKSHQLRETIAVAPVEHLLRFHFELLQL